MYITKTSIRNNPTPPNCKKIYFFTKKTKNERNILENLQITQYTIQNTRNIIIYKCIEFNKINKSNNNTN